MKSFPLIHTYPLTEPKHSSQEIQFANYEGRKLPKLRVLETPLEFALAMSNNHEDNSFSLALNEALNKSKEYKESKKCLPYLKEVPKIKEYRNNYNNCDLTSVNHSILENGKYLSKGQVLFHGGGLPMAKDELRIGNSFKLTSILSTSLCAGVAAAHSLRHKPDAYIWVINIRSESKVKAFVFNNKTGKHRHEKEVLLSSGGACTCTGMHLKNEIKVIEFELV